MPNVAGNVSTGKPKISGAVFVAPKGTQPPTDPTSELASAFKCLGYCSDDGLTNARDMSFDKIVAWGGDTVLSSLTESEDTFGMTLIEVKNIDVLKTVYGTNNVEVVTPEEEEETAPYIHVAVKSESPEKFVWVFEIAMTDGDKKRIVLPDASITGTEEIAYTDSDAIGYGITLTAYPDASGTTHHEYLTGVTA